MKTIKITEITQDAIKFSNGDTITYDHASDCCEYNYADFKQLDDLARGYKFEKPLLFESVPNAGFMFGDYRRKFFVPCYSEQNGYYTCELDIYYNDKKVLAFDAVFVDEASIW